MRTISIKYRICQITAVSGWAGLGWAEEEIWMRNDHLCFTASPPQPQHQPQLNSALCAEAFVCSYIHFLTARCEATLEAQLWPLASHNIRGCTIAGSCCPVVIMTTCLLCLNPNKCPSSAWGRLLVTAAGFVVCSLHGEVPSHHQPAGGILQHITHHRLGAGTKQQENIKCFFIHSKPLKVQVNGIKSFW